MIRGTPQRRILPSLRMAIDRISNDFASGVFFNQNFDGSPTWKLDISKLALFQLSAPRGYGHCQGGTRFGEWLNCNLNDFDPPKTVERAAFSQRSASNSCSVTAETPGESARPAALRSFPTWTTRASVAYPLTDAARRVTDCAMAGDKVRDALASMSASP